MDTRKLINQAGSALVILLTSTTLAFAASSEGVGIVNEVAVESGTISIDNQDYLIRPDTTRLTIDGRNLRLDKLAPDVKVYFQVTEKERYSLNHEGPKTLSVIRLLGPKQAIDNMLQN